MTLVKVKDSPFVRDTSSMALFNADQSAKTDYQSKMNMIMKQNEELNSVREEIDTLKTDIADIKDLLTKLLEK
jgi:septal ring factor EnvC (AmiA/AmiB activator)